MCIEKIIAETSNTNGRKNDLNCVGNFVKLQHARIIQFACGSYLFVTSQKLTKRKYSENSLGRRTHVENLFGAQRGAQVTRMLLLVKAIVLLIRTAQTMFAAKTPRDEKNKVGKREVK